jgi:DNA-binding MarR family transcriptional regulator
VRFQILARLNHSSAGTHRMTDLADGVVYSRSGLTYQAGLLEARGLISRSPSRDDERSTAVAITDAGRALVERVLPATSRSRSDVLVCLRAGVVAVAHAGCSMSES